MVILCDSEMNIKSLEYNIPYLFQCCGYLRDVDELIRKFSELKVKTMPKKMPRSLVFIFCHIGFEKIVRKLILY